MVNVQMCKCANVRMVAFTCCVLMTLHHSFSLNSVNKGDHLHICTFAHLHINHAFTL